MSETADKTPAGAGEGSYRRLSGIADSQQAIDEVIAEARVCLRIFDVALGNRGFNSPQRIETLQKLIVSGRANRLLIALHEPETLERDSPRLLRLLRQFPTSIQIHRTLGQARQAHDPFIVADDHSVWHQMHFEQPRAIVALHSPADTTPILQRFDEIWDQSEPAVSATTLGL
jgi:hypothetical protein